MVNTIYIAFSELLNSALVIFQAIVWQNLKYIYIAQEQVYFFKNYNIELPTGTWLQARSLYTGPGTWLHQNLATGHSVSCSVHPNMTVPVLLCEFTYLRWMTFSSSTSKHTLNISSINFQQFLDTI